MNLVDSSGWLEYFADSKNADNFTEALEDTSNLLVSTINTYEVFKKVMLESGEENALLSISMMHQAQVIPVDIEISLLAAKISKDYKLAMADSLILATAQVHNAILWTQDAHFNGLKNVKYFEKQF